MMKPLMLPLLFVGLVYVNYLCAYTLEIEGTVIAKETSEVISSKIIRVQHPKILIVSMPRSGSTFLMDTIGSHPNIVKMFETGTWISGYKGCDANSIMKYRENSTQWRWFWDVYSCNYTTEFKSNLTPFSIQKSGNMSSCDVGNPPSKMVVAKEIWPWGIRLNWLNKVLDKDLRVISLTRDVRGFVSSYTYVPVEIDKDGNKLITEDRTLYRTWNMHDIGLWDNFCLDGLEVPVYLRERLPYLKRVLDDRFALPHLRMASIWTIMVAVSQHQLTTLFEGRHISVTHSEFSMHPHETIESVFDFLSGPQSVPNEVHQFIDTHTKGGGFNDRYSTARNSTEVANVWVQRLSASEIAEIEAIADQVMQLLGFFPISPHPLPDLDANNYARLPNAPAPPPVPVFAWETEVKA